MASDLKPPYRFPLLILGFVALGTGVLAGLARLGWPAPLPRPEVISLHGPLMISGFFGTVIGLERAVAIAQRWAYLGPLCAGLATLALLLGLPIPLAAFLLIMAGIVLISASFAAYRTQPSFHARVLLLGAASWGVGTLLWGWGISLPALLPWWMGFLALTIAGERLELSRFLPPSPRAHRWFVGLTLSFLIGALLSPISVTHGWLVAGLALLGFAGWLLINDVARRTVKQTGITRFIALCLLTGYGWLAVAGVLMTIPQSTLGAGLLYDAALHALFMGFVFSMVFGHAPIIFPAVTGLQVPYHPWFYIPLLVLHASLMLRLGGDLFAVADWRLWGGLGNGIAIALFVVSTIAAIVRGLFLPRTQIL
ncbi:MAG: hypothetical protein Kow006_27700 [Gammaproteobacteria bacterium]